MRNCSHSSLHTRNNLISSVSLALVLLGADMVQTKPNAGNIEVSSKKICLKSKNNAHKRRCRYGFKTDSKMQKNRHSWWFFLFSGPRRETRTPDILLPKTSPRKVTIFCNLAPIYITYSFQRCSFSKLRFHLFNLSK